MILEFLLLIVKIAAKTVIKARKKGKAKNELIFSDITVFSYPLIIKSLFSVSNSTKEIVSRFLKRLFNLHFDKRLEAENLFFNINIKL